MKKFNEWLAGKLADWLSTMIMFYAVSFLVVSILFFQKPGSPLEWIQFVVQCFFQGVALPVLAFVAKHEGKKTERLLRETHDTVLKEFSLIRDEVRAIQDIHDDLEKKARDDNETGGDGETKGKIPGRVRSKD